MALLLPVEPMEWNTHGLYYFALNLVLVEIWSGFDIRPHFISAEFIELSGRN